jgi:hypothetical protein
MSTDAPTSSAGSSQVDDWATISNDLLLGLVHALNNRVAALSAFVELARLGDARVDPLVELPIEVSHLQAFSGMLTLLAERQTNAEALELSAVLDEAVRLHEHHPRLRAERCDVRYEGTPPPVRAPRGALGRTLVMLVHAAKRSGDSAQGKAAAPIVVRSDQSTVSVHVSASANVSPDLFAAAERAGGEVTRKDDVLVFRLPSLAELRRREREAHGSVTEVSR